MHGQRSGADLPAHRTDPTARISLFPGPCPTTVWSRITLLVLLVLLGGADAQAAEAEPIAPSADTGTLPTEVLMDHARSEIAAGRPDAARRALRLVLAREPGDAAALQALATLDGVVVEPPAGDVAGTVELARQARLADARRLIARSEDESASGKPELALATLERADAALGRGVTDPEVEDLRRRIHERAGALRQGLDIAHGARLDQARVTAMATAEQTSAAAQWQARSLFRERIHRIEALERRQLLQSALKDCRALVRDHPESAQANALFQRLLAASHDQRDLDLEERHHELHQEILEQLQRSMIPTGFDGRPIFPEDWQDRHPGSDTILSQPQTVDPADEALRERLLRRISLQGEQVDAVQLLRELSSQHGLNVVIAPEVIAAGQLVSLSLADLTVEHALSWICRMIDTRWNLGNGGIFIGSESTEGPVTALYDLGEVLFQVRDQVPGARLQLGIVGNTEGTGVVAGPGGVFAAPVDEELPAIAPEDLVDQLTQAISPATWTRPDCGISIRHHSLLITAPPSVHVLVREYMRASMQRARLLVAIDARWITIADFFLEEIGVSWSTSGSLLSLPGPAANTSGLRRTTSDFDFQGELVNNLPAGALTPNPAILGTGLNLSGVLLDSLQLSAVLTAVERNRRAHTLAGGEVITFSGVRTHCFFGSMMAYLGGYDVAPGADGGLGATLTPTVSVLTLGTLVDVKPFISSDRKYVTMEFGSTLASLQNLFTESVQVIRSIPVGFDPDGNNGQGEPIVQNQVQNFGLELPNVEYTELRTNIMIPDGGTLLVGGWGRYIEQSMSTKIPFLGHLPFVGRLFGQRGRLSDRHKLTLLVTVNIVDYSELEALQ
jgi:hypothetical protein